MQPWRRRVPHSSCGRKPRRGHAMTTTARHVHGTTPPQGGVAYRDCRAVGKDGCLCHRCLPPTPGKACPRRGNATPGVWEGVSQVWLCYALCAYARSRMIHLSARCYGDPYPARSLLSGDRCGEIRQESARHTTLPLSSGPRSRSPLAARLRLSGPSPAYQRSDARYTPCLDHPMLLRRSHAALGRRVPWGAVDSPLVRADVEALLPQEGRHA
jgi:hypothetical protein